VETVGKGLIKISEKITYGAFKLMFGDHDAECVKPLPPRPKNVQQEEASVSIAFEEDSGLKAATETA